MDHVADLGLAKVIGSALIALVSVLGGIVTFFLHAIFRRFSVLIEDVNEIKLDVALLKAAGNYEPDDDRTNGSRHAVKRGRLKV